MNLATTRQDLKEDANHLPSISTECGDPRQRSHCLMIS